jgi:hypothetical protein
VGLVKDSLGFWFEGLSFALVLIALLPDLIIGSKSRLRYIFTGFKVISYEGPGLIIREHPDIIPCPWILKHLEEGEWIQQWGPWWASWP